MKKPDDAAPRKPYSNAKPRLHSMCSLRFMIVPTSRFITMSPKPWTRFCVDDRHGWKCAHISKMVMSRSHRSPRLRHYLLCPPQSHNRTGEKYFVSSHTALTAIASNK